VSDRTGFSKHVKTALILLNAALTLKTAKHPENETKNCKAGIMPVFVLAYILHYKLMNLNRIDSRPS